MIIVGLTGGIASGKSFVGALFRKKGVPVIDADQLSREVVRPGTEGFGRVARAFPEAVTAQGLDRTRLGQIIFADPLKRRELEDIIHPLVRREFLRQKDRYERAPLLVYEVPLLFEKGIDREMDVVVVVDVPVEVQRERLFRRSGLSEEEANGRLSSQWSREERNARADFLLSGLLSEEETGKAIDELVPKLLDSSGKHEKGER